MRFYRKDRPQLGPVISGVTKIAAALDLSVPYTAQLLEAGKIPAARIDHVWIANEGLLRSAPRPTADRPQKVEKPAPAPKPPRGPQGRDDKGRYRSPPFLEPGLVAAVD